MTAKRAPKPAWLKTGIPAGDRYKQVRRVLSSGRLNTVCEEARCPNIGDCWETGTATFMILGDTCTRGCRFCAVKRGDPGGAIDPGEPERVAAAAKEMGLNYAVVTSVTRDDLPDRGAGLFADTAEALKSLEPKPLVELLVPDYGEDELKKVLGAPVDLLAHNVEVVERLSPLLRHPKFSFRGSLRTLEIARALGPKLPLKSSIMLGLGETDCEVEAAMRDLRAVGTDILVLGQYLAPTREHAEVREYAPPERFDALAAKGRELGFGFVAAGPLVRTSYKAGEAFFMNRRLGKRSLEWTS